MGGIVVLASGLATQAAEPDGLQLPQGFHASVVADGITGARHLAFRSNGDLFVSLRGEKESGVVAIHFDADHKAAVVKRFGDVGGGTGIRFHRDAIFVAAPTAVYRFELAPDALTPVGEPVKIIVGMPDKGFTARPIAFDDRGHLYVGVGGGSNLCVQGNAAAGEQPQGLSPCPDLAVRAGIWRFDANRPNQQFPSDGTRIATGVRDVGALDWDQNAGLHMVMHNRNGTSRTWPQIVSPTDENAIAEEMHRLGTATDLGWPYTYYDGARGIRLVAPEYGGDGKTQPTNGKYATPEVAFPGHGAPLDLVFYTGRQFPKKYRNGAFVVFHGGNGPDLPDGHNGYDVMFVPFSRTGKAGSPLTFATGFAGEAPADRNVSRAKYRPVGAAVAPDGSLFIADSNRGRIWRISYGEAQN